MGRRVLQRHIWIHTVCLCPIKRAPGLYKLKSMVDDCTIQASQLQLLHNLLNILNPWFSLCQKYDIIPRLHFWEHSLTPPLLLTCKCLQCLLPLATLRHPCLTIKTINTVIYTQVHPAIMKTYHRHDHHSNALENVTRRLIG